MLFQLLIIVDSTSQDVKILGKSNPTAPYNGWIQIRATGPLAPFTITIVRQDGWYATKYGINGDVYFYSLSSGMYKIIVQGFKACPYEFEVILIDCESLKIINTKITDKCNTQSKEQYRATTSLGSVSIEVTGGLPPYKFEWRDQNGVNLNILVNKATLLEAGFYTVKVTDKNNCSIFQKFEIKSSKLRTDVKRQIAFCYTQDNVELLMEPFNKEMTYIWSNGQKSNSYGLMKWTLYNQNGKDQNVNIIDPATNCSLHEKFSLSIGEWYLIPEIKQSPSSPSSNDGIVNVYFALNSNFYGNWNGYGLLEIQRNGSFFRYENVDPKGGSRSITLYNLPEGEYHFILTDQKACFIASDVLILYYCENKSNIPTIKINDYSLPYNAPDSYIKASATYYGGDISKCKYKWFSNEHYFKYTSLPEIYHSDLLKVVSGASKYIYVRMMCPCGIVEDKILHSPCDEWRIPIKNKILEHFCYGTLPTGKVYEPDKIAKIEFDIETNSTWLSQGPQGLSIYNKRIKEFKWIDGTPVDYSFNSNAQLIHISRTIEYPSSYPGSYDFELVDGNGCIHQEFSQVGNTFKIEEGSEDKCIYFTSCNGLNGLNDLEKHIEGKLQLSNINNSCEAYFSCGEKLISKITGYTQFGEYTTTIGQTTNCTAFKWCVFNTLFTSLDPKFNPGLQIYYTDPSNKITSGKTYGYYKEIEVPCCTDLPSNVLEFKERLKLINESGIDFEKMDMDDESKNPCVGIVKCSSGYYYKYNGILKSEYYCKLADGTCKRCITCEFNPNGVSFTTEEKCFTLNTRNCNDSRDCPPVSPPPIENLETRSQISNVQVFPNPFNEEIIIRCPDLNSNKEVKCDVSIYNATGESFLNTNIYFSNTESDKKINTKSLPSGFYILKCNFENAIVQSFKIIKI